MVKAVRGVDGRLPPASGRVQPHNSTDPGEFPYVSHLLGSVEAAGTRPLTEILENPRAAGSVRLRVPSIHARSKTGWMGIAAPARLLWLDIRPFSTELQRFGGGVRCRG